jgi:hypothetical protein
MDLLNGLRGPQEAIVRASQLLNEGDYSMGYGADAKAERAKR